MPERRFPPPWTVEELDACFVVKDNGGQKLAYIYYEDEPGRRSVGATRFSTVYASFMAEPRHVAGGLCDYRATPAKLGNAIPGDLLAVMSVTA